MFHDTTYNYDGILFHRGFRMSLNNEFSLSVQWGYMNYCENRAGVSYDDSAACPSAEIAIFFGDNMMPISKGDDVAGYVSADKVAKILGILQSVDTEKEGFYGNPEDDRRLFVGILQEDIQNILRGKE